MEGAAMIPPRDKKRYESNIGYFSFVIELRSDYKLIDSKLLNCLLQSITLKEYWTQSRQMHYITESTRLIPLMYCMATYAIR